MKKVNLNYRANTVRPCSSNSKFLVAKFFFPDPLMCVSFGSANDTCMYLTCIMIRKQLYKDYINKFYSHQIVINVLVPYQRGRFFHLSSCFIKWFLLRSNPPQYYADECSKVIREFKIKSSPFQNLTRLLVIL